MINNVVAYKREWYLKNRDRILHRRMQRYNQNKEAEKNSMRDYYKNNKSRLNKMNALWKKNNRKRCNELNRLRRLRTDVKKQEKNYRKKIRNKSRKYLKNYRLGKIMTPTIIKVEKKLSTLKNLYYKKGWDAKSISEHFGCSKDTIIAVLNKNNLPIKQKKYTARKKIVCSNGLIVRSNPERIIVEILLRKNISFEYEPLLEHKNFRFKPDFHLPEKDVYIEYAGLTDKKWYNKQLEKKKQVMNKLEKNYSVITNPEQILCVV